MSPELPHESLPDTFQASPVEQYREVVQDTDPEAIAALTKAILILRQEAKDEAREEFRVGIEAIRGYFKEAASQNNGSVPIATAESILNDVLEAKK